jgi:hypothetical protein
LNETENIERIFFKVLEDLKDYLADLTLVGGWMSYVYSRFLWNNFVVKSITTTDIDFGVSSTKTKVHPTTIFELLSTLDYKERHPRMDRLYPVVLYKEGKVRLDFIAPAEIKAEIIEKLIGRQIDINKIDKFEFLLEQRIVIEVKDTNKERTYKINCPKPSAFLYHKAATFIHRDDEQKQAKDLHYIYFMLRYAPDLDAILKEVVQYKKKGYFKDVLQNLDRYFARKTSSGCLMVEKENGPDEYIDDLRQDIFERFRNLREVLRRYR